MESDSQTNDANQQQTNHTHMNNNLEQMAPINQQELQQPSLKDVSPVTNTIKNLVSSLEMFGYQINISEEDLPTTSKITIEIQK